MRIYIIHSPENTENYIERIKSAEEALIELGHHILNPLPEELPEISNEILCKIYGEKIIKCDAVFAMLDWDKSDTSNKEMARAHIMKKIITFEQLSSPWQQLEAQITDVRRKYQL